MDQGHGQPAIFNNDLHARTHLGHQRREIARRIGL